jgi:hypothetical protein
MQLKVWVSLNLVGCRKETTIDIPDEDLEGSSESAKEIIEEYAEDAMWQMIEWGYMAVGEDSEV